jgi:hypothetical protein
MMRLSALLMLGAVMIAGQPLCAQRSQSTQTTTPPSQPGVMPPLDASPDMDNPMRGRMEAERMKALNDDRHKRLAADVDRLVELTNELKTDVNNTGKNELSLDVIKKAQEIEKLAHDVQNRMKN